MDIYFRPTPWYYKQVLEKANDCDSNAVKKRQLNKQES